MGTGPDVLLVHAFTSNLAVWMLTGIAEKLSRDFRVTCYDLRGHGVSTVTPTGYRSDELANDLHDLARTLAIQPAFIVGHSYGGVVAMHAAISHPHSVCGIILSDTYFPGLRHLEPDMGQSGPWQDLRESLLTVNLEIGETVDFGQLFRLVADLPKDKIAEVERKLGPSSSRWLLQIAPLANTTAARDAFDSTRLTAAALCGIEQPVVALYDEFSPFNATCDYLKNNLKNCTIDVVPEAKHLAPLQNPEVFADMVRTYLHKMNGSCTS